jgi:hypothetical protein
MHVPKNNDILNIVKKFAGVPKMPSLPSPLHSCPYCEILGHDKVEFSSEDLLERHGVRKHPGWPMHSELDIKKFRNEYARKSS